MEKTTILLIDDAVDLRENISELLGLAGFTVIQASDGKEALGLLKKCRPDLILCDILMPDVNGYEVLQIIRNNPDMINIPFIFTTSKSEAVDLRKGMSLGADDYLIHPIIDEDLFNAISVRLKRSCDFKEKYTERSKKIINLISDTTNFNDILSSSPFKAIRKIHARGMIYLEGDTVNFVYCILKGKVETFKTNQEGKDIITALYKEGDIFGHASFLEDCHKESCIATEESEIICIPREEFLQILSSNSGVALKFIKSISSHYLEEGAKKLEIAYNSSRKRIADALLFYNQKYNESCKEDFHFDRSDIAALAGVAKESVSRALTDFSERGLIEVNVKTGNVKILDYKKFERLEI